MKELIKTSNYYVSLEETENDILLLRFSKDGLDYDVLLPDCIYARANEICPNHDRNVFEKGWSSYLGQESGSFKLFGIWLKGADKEYRLNVVTYDNRVIHTRLLHTKWANEVLRIEKYSDSIVIIKDFSDSSSFVDNTGHILLKTDGIPGWTYEKLNGGYKEFDKPRVNDIVMSRYLLLAKCGNRWAIYNEKFIKIKDYDELEGKIVNGRGGCNGYYLILVVFDPSINSYNGEHACKSIIIDKNGNPLYSRDDTTYYDIREYKEVPGVFYATVDGFMQRGDLPVFCNGKYLFNVLSKSQYSLFDDGYDLAVNYQMNGLPSNQQQGLLTTQKRFGVIDRELNVVIPTILDAASIERGSCIRYSINGKTGLWNKSLSTVIPLDYASIYATENFFLASKTGGFPNQFWTKCLHMIKGNDSSYAEDNGKTSGCKIIKANGELSVNETFDDVYVHFNHYKLNDGSDYTSHAGLCIVQSQGMLKYGILNRDGEFIVLPKYDYLEVVEDIEADNRYGIKAYIYAVGGHLHEEKMLNGRTKTVRRCGLYGVLSSDGSALIPALYDAVIVFGDYIRVRKKNNFGLFSIDGQLLIDTICTAINFIGVDNKTTMAVYNIDGTLRGDLSIAEKCYSYGLRGFDYSVPDISYSCFYDDNNIIEGGTWGYYNLEKRIRGEALYSEVHPFHYGKAIAKYNGSYYLINSALKTIDGPKPSISQVQGNDDYYDVPDSGYSQRELDDMFRGAFEGDASAEWNTD